MTKLRKNHLIKILFLERHDAKLARALVRPHKVPRTYKELMSLEFSEEQIGAIDILYENKKKLCALDSGFNLIQ